MRTAIYARMSTDKQSDTSPEDQIARCHKFAGREGVEMKSLLAATELLPSPVNQRSDRLSSFLLQRRYGMRVHVQCQRDCGMTQPLRHHLRVNPSLQGDGCVAVSKPMQCEPR